MSTAREQVSCLSFQTQPVFCIWICIQNCEVKIIFTGNFVMNAVERVYPQRNREQCCLLMSRWLDSTWGGFETVSRSAKKHLHYVLKSYTYPTSRMLRNPFIAKHTVWILGQCNENTLGHFSCQTQKEKKGK